jgi:hypothetical protein
VICSESAPSVTFFSVLPAAVTQALYDCVTIHNNRLVGAAVVNGITFSRSSTHFISPPLVPGIPSLATVALLSIVPLELAFGGERTEFLQDSWVFAQETVDPRASLWRNSTVCIVAPQQLYTPLQNNL